MYDMSCHPPRGGRCHFELDSGQRKHLDERIARELVDLGAHEVADPRLTHAEQACGPCLREFAHTDDADQFRHEPRPQLQAGRLKRREAEVGEKVAVRFRGAVARCLCRGALGGGGGSWHAGSISK